MPKPPLRLESAHGTCKGCAFLDAQQCHRFPPQIVVGETEDGDEFPLSLYPTMDDDDWCGEFRGKL